MQFKCGLCSFVSELASFCKSHIVAEHPNWKKVTEAKTNLPGTKQSPHSNPSWLQDLKAEFNSIIIAKCSERARIALAADLIIKV